MRHRWPIRTGPEGLEGGSDGILGLDRRGVAGAFEHHMARGEPPCHLRLLRRGPRVVGVAVRDQDRQAAVAQLVDSVSSGRHGHAHPEQRRSGRGEEPSPQEVFDRLRQAGLLRIRRVHLLRRLEHRRYAALGEQRPHQLDERAAGPAERRRTRAEQGQ